MKRVIIAGSPRANGRSGHLAEMLFEACIDESPGDELFLVPVSEVEIGPCIGCNACREQTEVTTVADDGTESVELRPRCIFDDDMQGVYDLLDDADEVTVVSPIYFSGAPSVLKCLLDRLQPYFWADTRKAGKRPLVLHVVGEGGDPHGYGALVSEVRSSFACAGFRLDRILDWVGKIDARGEIIAEAQEVEVPQIAGTGSNKPSKKDDEAAPTAQVAKKPRPKLDLGASGKPSARKDSSATGGRGKPVKSSESGTKQRNRQQGKGKRRG